MENEMLLHRSKPFDIVSFLSPSPSTRSDFIICIVTAWRTPFSNEIAGRYQRNVQVRERRATWVAGQLHTGEIQERICPQL